MSPRKKPDPEPSFETSDRDYFLARLAVTRSHLAAGIEAIDCIVALTVDPEEDQKGKEREDLISAATLEVGLASRSLASAELAWHDEGADLEIAEGEEYEEGDDEDGEGDEDEDEDEDGEDDD